MEELYPPSPAGLPSTTKTTVAYRLHVALVLLSLATFMLLYVGLIAGAAYGLYGLLTGLWVTGAAAIFWISGVALLLVFLVKNVFRPSRPERAFVQITEAEQPRLFAFLRRLCAEAKCEFPNAVYLSPDVNAAVFYPRSALSLFIPLRKNLRIGLGLVNGLNISEFKAVLAHEFGHFSQSSMKLGQYVYVANEVVRDIVFTRDSWDELLGKWCSLNIRLSFPAWALICVLGAIRWLLERLFKLVNFGSRALSRQMEFDADLQAASLAGSDAVVSALWKSERANLAYIEAWEGLSTLLSYDKFTNDVFHHQRRSAKRVDEILAKNAEPTPYLRSLREAYRPGPALHFDEANNHATSMWATHPSHRERERNVKREYVASVPLDVSAWQLFDKRKALKQRLTLVAYRQRLEREVRSRACLPAKEVEALLSSEREELRQAPHYHGFYENRMVNPGDLFAHTDEIDSWPAARRAELRAAASEWSGAKLATFRAQIAAAGSPQQAQRLRERFPGADAAIFRHFYACSLNENAARLELLERYIFLLTMQVHIINLNAAELTFRGAVESLKQNREPGPEAFRKIQAALVEVHERVATVLAKSIKLRVPKLEHLKRGSSVRDYIADEALGPRVGGNRITAQELTHLGRVVAKTLSRSCHLHFKNLGSLLRLQERLDPTLYVDRPPEAPEVSTDQDDEEDEE